MQMGKTDFRKKKKKRIRAERYEKTQRKFGLQF